MNEVNCTVGEGQGKDLTVRFSINKLKIAMARLHQIEEKNCLSLSPVSMIMMHRREFSLRAKAKLVVEMLLKGRQMVKILLLEKKEINDCRRKLWFTK